MDRRADDDAPKDPANSRREPDIGGMSTERVDGEPWVKLATGKDLANWSLEHEIRYNQGNRQTEKHQFFRRIFDFLKENGIKGDYLEFGCHRCRTFRMALSEARLHDLAQMKFWAFDSFEGLPEVRDGAEVSLWKRGALTTSEDEFLGLVRAHGIYADRVRTIKGFYDGTLTPLLRQRFEREEAKIALATIDCDLYESAVPVFDFIDPLLQEGSSLYIDDLFVGYRGVPTRGVARAFLEYQRRSRWKFVRHLDIGWWGRSYIAYTPDGAIDGTL